MCENNYDCGAEKMRVRVCICEHLPFALPFSDCQFERDQKTILRYLICVAASSRPELVFFLVFKKLVGRSDVVCYCDCCHVCDDEESPHEDHDESDHVHEDHDDHCSASGSEDCLVMFSMFHSARCLYSEYSSVFTVSLPPPW